MVGVANDAAGTEPQRNGGISRRRRKDGNDGIPSRPLLFLYRAHEGTVPGGKGRKLESLEYITLSLRLSIFHGGMQL